MAAVGFYGFSYITFLFLLAGSNGSQDLVSLISARDYFKARSIEVRVDRMVEVAGRTGKDGQSSVAQLLAIRWLGQHSGKMTEPRALLEQIAAGKKANDRLGFAREYAQRALARLDHKPVPLQTIPADSLRADALKWFPAPATIFGGLDFRPGESRPSGDDNDLLTTFMQIMPEREKREMFEFADKVGNIRVDRVSFAVIPGAKESDSTRIFVRLTGLADIRRLVAFIRKEGGPVAYVQEKKGADGERITFLEFSKSGPAMAFVGNHDLLVGGFDGSRNDNHREVLEEALQVRAGKKASIVRGPYAGTLKSSPSRAAGLLIGDLPEAWYKGPAYRWSPFQGNLKSFNLSMTRTAKGTEFKFSGSAPSAKEARAFVESVNRLKKEGIEGLKHLPARIKVSPKSVAALQAALRGIKVDSQDALLTGSALLSPQANQAIIDLAKATLVRNEAVMEEKAPVEKAVPMKTTEKVVIEKKAEKTVEKTVEKK